MRHEGRQVARMTRLRGIKYAHKACALIVVHILRKYTLP